MPILLIPTYTVIDANTAETTVYYYHRHCHPILLTLITPIIIDVDTFYHWHWYHWYHHILLFIDAKTTDTTKYTTIYYPSLTLIPLILSYIIIYWRWYTTATTICYCSLTLIPTYIIIDADTWYYWRWYQISSLILIPVIPPYIIVHWHWYHPTLSLTLIP